MQVQSARKSNCTGCLELPETDWKLRAELSGAPGGLTRLCVCFIYIYTRVCCCHTSARITLCYFILHVHVHVPLCTSSLCLHMQERAGPRASINKTPGLSSAPPAFPRQAVLTTASSRPAGCLTLTVESPGPVSPITCALGPPGTF